MEHQWNSEWEADSEVYTASQVEAVLEYCEIEIESENANGFSAYCPFHGNTDSPAFGINSTTGRWACFNPACDRNGSLMDLLRMRKGLNPFEALRVIKKYEGAGYNSVSERLRSIMAGTPEFVEFPQEPVTRMQNDLWTPGNVGHKYMVGRGFEDETLKHFGVGYSAKRNMVIVPMHDPTGMLVGFIGRSVEDKIFKNTTNLPKSKTAWNFHRAKRCGDTVIIVEASFDAMRVHQAGYPNVIALLGGFLSRYHIEQIAKTFSTIIIATDFDKKQYPVNCTKCKHLRECTGHRPGRELGWSIARNIPHKTIMWAAYDDTCVYPHGAKDMSDQTDDEIRQSLTGAVSHFTYSQWGIENQEAVAI